LSFDEHAAYFAEHCDKCQGKRFVIEEEKRVICSCQSKALVKHRYDQIPTDLKNKDWEDYTGDFIQNNKEIRVVNWKESRDIAFGYCFSKKSINQLSKCELNLDKIKEILERRFSRSRIKKRYDDGSNLAILGNSFTGKTLLAALVAKEIIYASVLLIDKDVKWVSFNSLINSLSFNRVDYDLIDEISYVDFLILDNVNAPKQGNYMKNVIDELFYNRINQNLPIIITGSSDINRDDYPNRQALGDEFYRFLNSAKTQKIILQQSK